MTAEFIMIKSLLSTASAAAALAIIFSMPSQAEQISFIQNSSGLTFAAAPGNTLEVTTTGFGGMADYCNIACFGPSAMPDPVHDSSGNASFGPVTFFTGTVNTGPPDFFIPVAGSPSELFTYQQTSASPPGTPDFLKANITWTEVVSNTSISTSEPMLISVGAGMIIASSGDSAFTTAFPVGGDIDLTLNFFSPLAGGFPCTLTALAAGSSACPVTSMSASFEGGDATPGVVMTTIITTTGQQVPEPMSTFTALGIALFCLWGAYQLMRRERRLHGASA
jgi:hypothetical protein